MKLFEYMAKEIFGQNGIPVPQGRVAFSGDEAALVAREIGGSVVIKSQVLTGGRGKAGGIKFADTPEQAKQAAEVLLQSEIRGLKIEQVLVVEKIKIEKEIYVAIALDGAAQKPLVIASAHGGMDIEEVPEEHLVKHYLDANIGIMPYVAKEITRKMGVQSELAKQIQTVLQKMWQVFTAYDAELVEINPLVVSGDKVMAADGKMTIDDEACFRWPAGTPYVEERTLVEQKAHELGISYVELDGEIGVMANGAGITMATLDIIRHFGGSAKNFMDAGGGSSVEATAKALEILISTGPKAILVNIFGGITRCDDVAQAFAQVKGTIGIPVPVVIRLVGTNQDEGVRILKEIGINAYNRVDEAVAKVVELARQA